ncbi:mannose-1-phosphate guanyltransferase alpha-A [Agrilus planipennis]|uniref:Mannose-1-phosphate guanyltransferase alpha-A n=1 Tax=Agrilus planipennis TaxID=224129 RepID=A0A1W4XBV6_AGRPL|nr:mannose-1-phosphate guanyltransferase alpha-A [Agrilus planipennis]
MLKAVILIGGPQKGTRFRPLSLDIPKPLFPVAGFPIIQHHIEACTVLKDLKEILLIGFYPTAQIENFITEMQQQHNIFIKYLQEFAPLGTAGGLFHFRDQIRVGSPEAFFVMNGDVCADFKLQDIYEFHKSKKDKALVTIMSTEATRQQSLEYGCMVIDKDTQEVKHYVEKPSSYVSTLINCGVYLFSPDIFQKIGEVFNSKQQDLNRNGNGCKETGYIQLEQDILAPLAGTGRVFAVQTHNWWAQLKTAGSAIYANRHYLELYKTQHSDRLAETNSGENKSKCVIIPDVYVHPSANIHSTSVVHGLIK